MYRNSYSVDYFPGKSAYCLPKDDNQIRTEIMKFGPVTALMDVYQDFLTYKSGTCFCSRFLQFNYLHPDILSHV